MDSFSVYVVYFSIYSFLGWLCETIYCSIPAKRLVYRGFLHGPVCPIYGFGALIVLFLLKPFHANLVVLFFLAILCTSVLEYVTSFLLDCIFHTKWWDYSNKKYNLKGRIHLTNCILFGIMSVVLLLWIHPVIIPAVLHANPILLPYVSIFVLLYFITDTIVTTIKTLRLDNKLHRLGLLISHFKQSGECHSWFKENDLWESLGNLKAAHITKKQEEHFKTLASKIVGRGRLLSAFPHMMPKKSHEHFAEFKKLLLRKRKELKSFRPK